MAKFKHKTKIETGPFVEPVAERQIVALATDIDAEHAPSPALALQQMLAERTAAGFIADPAERRRALLRFVGAVLLLWGGSATALATMMMVVR